jgi:hypothetical protein
MSIEDFFYQKSKGSERDESTLYGYFLDKQKRIRVPNERTLQHYTYREIEAMIGIEAVKNAKIIVSIRNPFLRVISELFWKQRILPTSTPEEVFCQMYRYFVVEKNDGVDNHKLPQWAFLDGLDMSKVHIVHTETLDEDMKRLGYDDFISKVNGNKSKIPVNLYHKYFNELSVQFVREFYAKDFAQFGFSEEIPKPFLTTIVSAFIANINQNPTRSLQSYIDFGQHLLKIPNPKVIFVDTETYRRFYKDKSFPLTTFIPIEKESIYLYNYKNLLTNFHLNTNNASKDSMDYLFVQCNKTEWVSGAIDRNIYGTPQYIWLDFGIKNMISDDALFQREILRMTQKPLDGLRIASCKFKDFTTSDNHYDTVVWILLGSVFAGDAESLLRFAYLTKAEALKTMRERGTIVWEINLWYILNMKYPELMDFYVCAHDDRILELF